MTKELYNKLMAFGNDCEPFLTHNYMRTTDLDDGTATVTLPMHTESLNRWGGAHGGILFSLCDVAMGMSIMTLRQEMVVTVNATIDYLADGNDGMTALIQGEKRDCPPGATLRGLFMDYVERQTAAGKKITSRMEGRITVED